MIVNILMLCFGVIELCDVMCVFKFISVLWMRVRFGDVVGFVLCFNVLIIFCFGMVNEMEWGEVDWDVKCWIVLVFKMKIGWDYVVFLL